MLRVELAELSVIDLPFEIDMTGFTTPEIDLLDDKAAKAETLDEDAARTPGFFTVTARHDVWTPGSQRLLCGDARDEGCYAILMGEEKARMVLSDPPFNVRIPGPQKGCDAMDLGIAPHGFGSRKPAILRHFTHVERPRSRCVRLRGGAVSLMRTRLQPTVQ